MNADADADGGPSGARDAVRILASNRMAHSHRGGRRKTERHHERERRHVQRDLMRRERVGRTRARKRGRRREDANLEHRLPGRRQPEREQRALPREDRDAAACREARLPMCASLLSTTNHNQPAMNTRASSVAQADPRTPSAGSPK